MAGTELQRRKIVGAWLSFAWFFIFGLFCLVVLWDAPIYVVWFPWLMVALCIAAGGYLLWQRRHAA